MNTHSHHNSVRIMIFFALIFLCISNSIFAQQLSFGKKNVSTTDIQYTYEIAPLPSYVEKKNMDNFPEGYDVTFDLNSQKVKEAYRLIPNLVDLRREQEEYLVGKISPFIEKKTQQLEREYKREIMQAIATSLDMDSATLDSMSSGNTIETDALQVTCPEALIGFSFDYSVTGNHKSKYQILACSARGDTSMLVKQLMASVQKEVEDTNNKLQHGSELIMTTTGNSFRLKSKLSAPNQEELDKMKALLDEASQRISNLQQDYNKKSQAVERQIKLLQSHQGNVFKKYKALLEEEVNEIYHEFITLERQVYKDNYFVVEDIKGRSTIMLDFKRIADISLDDMQGVADALRDESLDQRAQIFKVMDFLQSIPYNTLAGREMEGFPGFLPPSAMLDKNQGDCDTKSVTMASILHLMYPDLPIVMVLVPGHAFVGVGLDSLAGESSVVYNGTNYVVAEPVGPKTSLLGEPSDVSASHMNANNFSGVIEMY